MTPTHADAFLQEILAHPDDDTPRLIYADWLDEHGGPAGEARAELIRVQCRLADATLRRELRNRLSWREHQLLRRHTPEWVRPLRGLGKEHVFHRGFVGEVRMGELAFLTTAERLFRRAPVQHLHLECSLASLRDRARTVPRLAGCPHLARLRTLDLSTNYLGSGGVQALAVSEHFGRLTALNLAWNGIGDGGVRALGASPLLGRLTSLDLSHNLIGPGGARLLAESLERLASSPEGLRLQTLSLTDNPLRAAGLRALRSSPLLRRVVRVQ
jgi:uncharacterized protein (TIGR02996 family)